MIALCSLRDSVRQELHIPRQSDQINDFDASATDRWPLLSLSSGLVRRRGSFVAESPAVFGTAQVTESPSFADRSADE